MAMTIPMAKTPGMPGAPQHVRWRDFPDNGCGDWDKKELCPKCKFATFCVPSGGVALSLISTFRLGRSINMLLCNHCGVAWNMGVAAPVEGSSRLSVLTEPLRVQCPSIVRVCSFWGQRIKSCPSCVDKPRVMMGFELIRPGETWGGCIYAGVIKYHGGGHVGNAKP